MAKRKGKTALVVFGLLLLAVITSLILTVTQTSFFSALSISDVDIVDSGARIRIYGVSNGAEALQIQFTPSNINPYIQSEGYEATKTVTGSIGLIEKSREFPMRQDTSKIFVSVTYKDVGVFGNCQNNAPAGALWSTRISTRYCAYGQSLGNYAFFTGQTIDNTQVLFEIGGSTGILNPSAGTNVLTLNDGRTTVEWTGNLVNTEQVGTPFQYGALFQNSQYSRLVDNDAYSQQTDALQNLRTCLGASSGSTLLPQSLNLLISVFKSDSIATTCVRTYNNQITQILANKQDEYTSSINAEGVSFTNNGIEVDLKTASVFPTFIMTLDASKVGIIELKGEPDIVSCVESKKITSGQTYSTSIGVRNIGEADGSFYGSVSCSQGATGRVTETAVREGQIGQLPVSVSGINPNEGTLRNNCQITITDRKSGISDTCSFNLDVEYQPNIECNPNSKVCLANDILQTCDSRGQITGTEICEKGCFQLSDTEAQCITLECEDDTDCEAGQDCVQGICIEQQIECGFGQTYYEKEAGFLRRGEAGCKTAGWVYAVSILVVLVLLVLIFNAWNKLKKKVRGK